jgi:hypothetical protein
MPQFWYHWFRIPLRVKIPWIVNDIIVYFPFRYPGKLSDPFHNFQNWSNVSSLTNQMSQFCLYLQSSSIKWHFILQGNLETDIIKCREHILVRCLRCTVKPINTLGAEKCHDQFLQIIAKTLKLVMKLFKLEKIFRSGYTNYRQLQYRSYPTHSVKWTFISSSFSRMLP